MVIPPLWTCLFVAFCAMATLLQPLFRYVLVGWHAKRKDIMDGLSPKARRTYFLMFSGSEKPPADLGVASKEFENLYERWYGRRYFVVPGMLLVLASLTTSVSVTFSTLGPGLVPRNLLFDLPAPAIAALGGAYLWVVNDHISRVRRLDFSPADAMWAVLRLVISVPMGYALAAFFSKDAGPFIAFTFGAFPLAGLMALMRRLTERQLDTAATADDVSDSVIKLQGINRSILDRLANEDITTVTQLAYCDPVRLTMRSGLTFTFVIDCMNQALAWMYLENQLDLVRPFGIRGALEIKWLMDELRSQGQPSDSGSSERAAMLIKQLAEALKSTPEALQFLFGQIAGDPYTIFQYEIWELPEGLEEVSGT